MSAELKTIAQAYDLVKATGNAATKAHMAQRLRELADELEGIVPPEPHSWLERVLRA